MSVLNLFPARIAFVNKDGTLTDQALRMLDVLVERAGGTLGDTGFDVFAAPCAPAAAALDVMQPTPGGADSVDLVQQPVPGTGAPADIVQQGVNYSAGTGITVADYRISLKDTPVTPGTYGDTNNVVQLVVDQQGRITGAKNVRINLPSGANYTGSLTGKTVTITNGIITSVT